MRRKIECSELASDALSFGVLREVACFALSVPFRRKDEWLNKLDTNHRMGIAFRILLGFHVGTENFFLRPGFAMKLGRVTVLLAATSLACVLFNGCADPAPAVTAVASVDALFIDFINDEMRAGLDVEFAEVVSVNRAGRLDMIFGKVSDEVSIPQFLKLSRADGWASVDKFKSNWILHADHYKTWQYASRIEGGRVREFIVRESVACMEKTAANRAGYRRRPNLMIMLDSNSRDFLFGITDFAAPDL